MKVCVIGVGRMGRTHIRVLKNLNYNVAGVFDPNSDALKQTQSELMIPSEACYSSAEEMLERTRPDGVVIASTAPSHCEYVCLAASASVKYILCEKPMAVSIAECDAMIEACYKSGSILAINHQMRFMEQYTKVKDLCESDELGGLRSVSISAGNFGLAMNGSHYFEMFRFMTGLGLIKLKFSMDEELLPNPRGVMFTDISGHLTGINSNNQRLHMEIGGDQGHGIHLIYGCRFGQIFVDELAGYVRVTRRQEEYRNLPSTRYGMPSVTSDFKIAPTEVIEPTKSVWNAMVSGKNYPDGSVGRQSVLALVAANVSGESSGACLSLEKELPKYRKFPWA
jgi:hypothetical protein